ARRAEARRVEKPDPIQALPAESGRDHRRCHGGGGGLCLACAGGGPRRVRRHRPTFIRRCREPPAPPRSPRHGGPRPGQAAGAQRHAELTALIRSQHFLLNLAAITAVVTAVAVDSAWPALAAALAVFGVTARRSFGDVESTQLPRALAAMAVLIQVWGSGGMERW